MQQALSLGITWTEMQQTLAMGRGISKPQVAGGLCLRAEQTSRDHHKWKPRFIKGRSARIAAAAAY